MVWEATPVAQALSPVSQYFLPTSHQEIHPTHPVQAYVHHFQCKTLFAEKNNFPFVDAERRMTNLFYSFVKLNYTEALYMIMLHSRYIVNSHSATRVLAKRIYLFETSQQMTDELWLRMRIMLVLLQCRPWFVGFTTSIAGNWNVSHMIWFNVIHNCPHVSFFATHITYSCSSLLFVDHIFTESHHRFHLCV